MFILTTLATDTTEWTLAWQGGQTKTEHIICNPQAPL